MDQPTNMSATEEKEPPVGPATKKSAGGPKDSDKQKSKNKLTWMLVHSVLAAAIGSGFQHGYNAAVLNSPQKLVVTWMNETLQASDAKLEIVWSMTVSIVCVGGIIGSALTSILASRFGRRMTLISNNGIATLAGLMMGTAKYINGYWLLILGRFVSGLNAGLNAGVAPMYLSEISPMRLRGSIGAMYQLVLTISILIAQILGHENVLGTECCWPMLLYLIIIPAIYQVVALFFSPDSPKYLLETGKDEKAIKASEQLCGKVEGEANIETIKNEIAAAREQPKVTMHDMVKVKKFRKPLIIMCLLMAAQQLSGINAVIYYSTDIFKAGGLSESTAQLATVGVGVVNVLVTIAGVFLVEAVGRKPLLAVGFCGMSVDLVLFMMCLKFADTVSAMAVICIVLMYIYIVLFAVGAGAIPWILGSELFTTAARPLGLSVAVATNWLFNFIVGLGFPPMKSIMGPFVFSIFIVCNVFSAIFFLCKVPETKNRPIEQITATFE